MLGFYVRNLTENHFTHVRPKSDTSTDIFAQNHNKGFVD